MDFIEPEKTGFTIYSKSGCHNCTKLKKIVKEKQLKYVEVCCDDYLVEDRENFLSFIETKMGKQCRVFPMVFYDGRVVGGFQESVEYVDKLLVSFDVLF